MSRFSRLEPLTYTEKNRLICRILNEMNRKVELWGAFLDSNRNEKIIKKRLICRTLDKRNRKNRVVRRFSRLGPTNENQPTKWKNEKNK
jgi:hypothetical protein